MKTIFVIIVAFIIAMAIRAAQKHNPAEYAKK